MEQTRIKSKPLEVKIIAPTGLIFFSHEIPDSPIVVNSITAKGVIPMEGNHPNLSGDILYEFEILPDHSPLVSKIAPKSNVTLFGSFEKGSELKLYTEFGGIITTNFDDVRTLIVITLQDAQKIEEKK